MAAAGILSRYLNGPLPYVSTPYVLMCVYSLFIHSLIHGFSFISVFRLFIGCLFIGCLFIGCLFIYLFTTSRRKGYAYKNENKQNGGSEEPFATSVFVFFLNRLF